MNIYCYTTKQFNKDFKCFFRFVQSLRLQKKISLTQVEEKFVCIITLVYSSIKVFISIRSGK